MIGTDRLELRPFTPAALLALFESEEAFARSFGVPLAAGLRGLYVSGEVSPAWIEKLRQAPGPDPWTLGFAVLDRREQLVIGSVGFKGPVDADGVVEIAYGIAPGFQRHGLATEATEAGVIFAFRHPAVRVVRAHTLAGNVASVGVVRRCGFDLSGEVEDPDDGAVLRWERERPGRAPARVQTARLMLTAPSAADAPAIFARYASDVEVTRYLSWPRHRTLADTEEFVRFSASEWASRPAGSYVIRDRRDGRLLGATGLGVESSTIATTGYVLARDVWGLGYATEALRAMVDVALTIGIRELSALCHAHHAASMRVLEKGGFARDAAPVSPMRFPNLGVDEPQPVVRYILVTDGAAA